jgi:hypothetical protein
MLLSFAHPKITSPSVRTYSTSIYSEVMQKCDDLALNICSMISKEQQNEGRQQVTSGCNGCNVSKRKAKLFRTLPLRWRIGEHPEVASKARYHRYNYECYFILFIMWRTILTAPTSENHLGAIFLNYSMGSLFKTGKPTENPESVRSSVAFFLKKISRGKWNRRKF